MKLTNYMIYESNVSAAQKGKKITDNIMEKLWTWLNKNQFVIGDFALMDFLNKVSPRYIEFELTPHKRNLGRLLGYGWFNTTLPKREKPENTISLHLTKNAAGYFRRFSRKDKKDIFFDRRKNQFYKELYELLTHELTHELQVIKSNWKIRWDWKEMDSSYLSDKGEIDAFALQAALQIIHSDRSGVWDIYSSHKAKGLITDKVYNRFMKKVYSNIKELQKLGMTK